MAGVWRSIIGTVAFGFANFAIPAFPDRLSIMCSIQWIPSHGLMEDFFDAATRAFNPAGATSFSIWEAIPISASFALIETLFEFSRQTASTVEGLVRAILPSVARENLVLIVASGMLALGLILVLSGIRLRRSAKKAAATAQALTNKNRPEAVHSEIQMPAPAIAKLAAASEGPDISLDPTRRARPGDLALPMPETTIETTESEQFPPQAPRAWLHFLDAKGTRVPIGATAVRIGRHTENEIILENRTVHRHHAVLHMTPAGKFVITDLDTVNRVFVNQQASKVRELEEGDLVELGEVKFRFRMVQ